MADATDAPPLSHAQALALGLLHGPAELLPISSSGHIALIPWLAGWDYSRSDPEVRKAFEVALHAGTAVALLIGLREEVIETITRLDADSAARIVVASIPAAIAGLTLEKPIERRLGTPATLAVGMAAGALAMAWADRSPQERDEADWTIADATWMGLAQAVALVPGVSRNGSTLTAARRLRFGRVAANRLSRRIALPVIGGATGLKTLRLLQHGLPPGAAAPLAIGAGASFLSTLASTRVYLAVERDRSLTPIVAYRLALAAIALGRAMRSA